MENKRMPIESDAILEQSLTVTMYNMATSNNLSLSEAVTQLRENAHSRTVLDTLSKLSQIPQTKKAELQKFFTSALQASCLDEEEDEATAKQKKEALRKRVSTWLKGDYRMIDKISAIQLCFALGKSAEESIPVLNLLTEEGFHWRNPEELVYLYGLNHKLTYAKTRRLLESMKEKGAISAPASPKDTLPMKFTLEIREKHPEDLEGIDALEQFLRLHQDELGNFHNTAYDFFENFMEILKNPRDEFAENEDREMSVREIVSLYLYRHLLKQGKRKKTSGEAGTKAAKSKKEQALSRLQKEIKRNWPDETVLSKMEHRETDISRKVLILLFLATDGGDSLYGDMADYSRTAEEDFQDMCMRLDLMLAESGFSPLDPRSPFDWMILYCMCADDSFLIDQTMQGFLESIYSQHAQEEAAIPEGPVAN